MKNLKLIFGLLGSVVLLFIVMQLITEAKQEAEINSRMSKRLKRKYILMNFD